MRSMREERGTQATTKQYDEKPSDREGETEREKEFYKWWKETESHKR
jgi:hypothetical protein